MTGTVSQVLQYLDQLNIHYRVMTHAPADTMEVCAAVDAELGTLTPKNLFLATRHGRRFCLCLTRPDARFHTADVSRQAGYPRLSFAPEAELFAHLKCRPGSASPLGLIFDTAREVALLVDDRLFDVPLLGFHPCDNTQTVAVSGSDFFGLFLPAVGVVPVRVRV